MKQFAPQKMRMDIKQERLTDKQIEYDLLVRLKNNDSEAFESIYLRWHKAVYHLMLKITRSPEDAEDIAQDTFTTLWNSRDRIEPDKSLKAFIFLIARRSANRLFSRRGMYSDYLSEQDPLQGMDADPDEILIAEETQMLLLVAIESMPNRQKEIFKLHYYEQLSSAQIASKLDLSQENVRKQIYSAKKHIQGILSFIALIFLR